ncbi:DUF6283 family protein [Vibrio casei]|uniref:DUF6283 family protein n=1 Tax=Vibrio casei TaxID=673372 RepID=UPI000B5CC498|nr:DUF6283 family protein [Vibrio casei]
MANLPNVKRPCSQCPYRKDTQKGWLGRERIAGLLSQDLFVCHKKRHLQCAGHMIINGKDNAFVRMAHALGEDLELSGVELVFDSHEECIEHHS